MHGGRACIVLCAGTLDGEGRCGPVQATHAVVSLYIVNSDGFNSFSSEFVLASLVLAGQASQRSPFGKANTPDTPSPSSHGYQGKHLE
jgi:hypothetical protein